MFSRDSRAQKTGGGTSWRLLQRLWDGQMDTQTLRPPGCSPLPQHMQTPSSLSLARASQDVACPGLPRQACAASRYPDESGLLGRRAGG